MNYRLVERFVSINGEGPRAGALAVFLRFPGCNLDCGYCDTKWANAAGAESTEYTLEALLDYVKEAGVHHVTVTGGEPLLQPGMDGLLTALGALPDLHVEVETNGSVFLKPFRELSPHVSFTMDYKLPGSGMEDQMCFENFPLLRGGDALKFVCSGRLDLERAKCLLDTQDLSREVTVFLSPVFGAIEASEIVDFMREKRISARLQLQLHKYIWPVTRRGV